MSRQEIGQEQVQIGDKVAFKPGGHFVTAPDYLLPATLLADSFTCMRRACLSALTQPAVEDSRPSTSLVIGSLVHTVIQSLLLEHIDSDYCLGQKITALITQQLQTADCLLSLYACDGTTEEVRREAEEMLNSAQFYNWYHDLMRCNTVADIEESIWGTALGLKGKIDVTLVSKTDHSVRPLEIKTGKHNQNNVNHRGQLLIYTALLADRREQPVPAGQLYYTATHQTIDVPVRPMEIKGILRQRNQLAKHVQLGGDLTRLPAPLQNDHVCMRCFQRDTCLGAHAVSAESAVLPPEMESRFRHLFTPSLTPKLLSFCRKYLHAIAMEEEECLRGKMVLWNMPVSERLKLGRCIRVRLLDAGGCGGAGGGADAGGHCARRAVAECVDKFEESWLNVGDAVVISTGRHHGVAIGYIVECLFGKMTLSLDRPLVAGQTVVVDKDELTGSFGVLRGNVCKLLSDERLSGLVVDLRPPSFACSNIDDSCTIDDTVEDTIDDTCTIEDTIDNTCTLEDTCKRYTKDLDGCQKKAVQHVLSANDYALIVGMPGTGKTTTLAAVIAILLARGDSVLLVSHTHAAIDTVLCKLADQVDLACGLRIGPTDRVHEKLRFMTHLPTDSQATLNARLNSVQLVAGTCHSTQHHPLFMKRRSFTWCIVDEATQVTLPACLGALRLAGKFLLVGDPHQLPPLVRSRHPQTQKTLSNSLHHRLLEAHPRAACWLNLQYRMCEEIMSIPNSLVYDGRLTCANQTVSQRRLCIATDDPVLRADRPVVYIDTDTYSGGDCAARKPSREEQRVGTSFCNPFEVEIVHHLVCGLLEAQLPPHSIAVISPFRPQLRSLKALLPSTIELATVDRFQGRDFPCVIVSLVRSNPLQLVGELVADWQRINVAFTRAQCKLIVVGSRSTLRASLIFDLFLRLVDQNHWSA